MGEWESILIGSLIASNYNDHRGTIFFYKKIVPLLGYRVGNFIAVLIFCKLS